MLLCATDLALVPDRGIATVAGLVITRQRPGTASGVIFLTLEDETGVANVVVWPQVCQRFRRAVIAGRLLRIRRRVQREGGVIHLIAWRIGDFSDRLDSLGQTEPAGAATRRGAPSRRPVSAPRPRHPREQAKQIIPSRDFH